MIEINTRMPHSCACCFALGERTDFHQFHCRISGEGISDIEFYDMLGTKNPKMKKCPLIEKTNDTDPLPCPFCDNNAPNIEIIDDAYTHYATPNIYTMQIKCHQCGAQSAPVSGSDKKVVKAKAIAKWNNRPNK